jgi:hypothetical protein
MVPAERTVTVGVGHGKKAARNIDAWLRGDAPDRAAKHAPVTFEDLNLWYFGDAARQRIPLASYTQRELRYRTLGNTDPAEAERLAALAQQAVDQRWDTYEEMATRGPARFPADARRACEEDD